MEMILLTTLYNAQFSNSSFFNRLLIEMVMVSKDAGLNQLWEYCFSMDTMVTTVVAVSPDSDADCY